MQNSKKLYFLKQFPCRLCVDQVIKVWACVVRRTLCYPAAPKLPRSRLLFLKDEPHCKCQIPRNCTFLKKFPCRLYVDQVIKVWACIVRQTLCYPAVPKLPRSRLLLLKD